MGSNFIGGGQEEYFQPGTFEQSYKNVKLPEYNARSANFTRDAAHVGGESKFQNAMMNYTRGGNEQSLMKEIGNLGLSGDEVYGALQQAYTDPMTGSRLATEQVMNDPILGRLFGKGGSMEGAASEEKDLMSRGYSLKPEDYEAYGQASGDISRMFGQSEQDLTQSLANRGLASAPSGAAGMGFSGLQGNKMEMLANSQRQIADNRMQNNMQRLNATRSYLSGLGTQGAGAINQQYGRQLAGAEQNRGRQSDALQASNDEMNANLGRYNAALNAFSTNKNLEGQSFQSKTANYNPGLAGSFGAGFTQGIGNFGSNLGSMGGNQMDKAMSSGGGAAKKATVA